MVKHHVHTAYAYSPKFKQYTASAIHLESGHPGTDRVYKTARIGLGVTKTHALAEALDYMTDYGILWRGMPLTQHGRKPYDAVMAHSYYNDPVKG